MEWTLQPGDTIKRTNLHELYGGSRQSGMTTSSSSSNLLLFTDPKSGEQHGYYDGKTHDGAFEYTGTGKTGDQKMQGVNRSLRDHLIEGWHVRLFQGARGHVSYEGEFVLDARAPYEQRQVHATGGGPNRLVFVYRLLPKDTATPVGPTGSVAQVPIAQQNTETWLVTPAQRTKASAVESALVRRYVAHLEKQGDVVDRHRYTTSSGLLFNDIFNETRGQLIEAKGTSARPAVRMAIGQLLDYAHLESAPPTLGLLLPEFPPDDVVALLESLEIATIYPHGNTFVDTRAGGFV